MAYCEHHSVHTPHDLWSSVIICQLYCTILNSLMCNLQIPDLSLTVKLQFRGLNIVGLRLQLGLGLAVRILSHETATLPS